MLLKVVGDGECCSGVVGGVVPGLARRGGDGACPNARAWASWLSLERGMADGGVGWLVRVWAVVEAAAATLAQLAG